MTLNQTQKVLFKKLKRILRDHEILLAMNDNKFIVVDNSPFSGVKTTYYKSLTGIIDACIPCPVFPVHEDVIAVGFP